MQGIHSFLLANTLRLIVKNAHFDIHFAVLLFGFSGLFGKWVLANPVIIVEGRTLFATMALLIGFRLLKKKLFIPNAKTNTFIGLSAIVLTLHWLTFFHAIQVSSVAIGLIGFSTYPVFVTIFEPLLNQQRIRPIDILSASVVTLGLYTLAPSLDLSHKTTVGLAWAIASGALNAVFTLMNRRLVSSVPVFDLALLQQGFVAICLLPFTIAHGTLPDQRTLFLLFILGTLFTALPQGLYLRSLKYLKAQLISIVTCLEPVYSIALAALLLSEIPSTRTVLGAAIVMSAVAISLKSHK